MARPSRPWFRFYVEAVNDRKIRRLTPPQRWLWVAVLAAARQSPQPGHLLVAEGVAMTVEELADYSGMRVREVRAGLEVMASLGMVATVDDALFVPKWDARQFESDDVTARTSKHRSKERSNGVPGNAPDTETDTESEQRVMARKRATQLPDGWEPSDATKDWVRREFPAHAKRGVVEHFKDHCQAKGSTFKDFDLAFKNWVRNEAKFHPAPESKGPGRTYL